jgi:hypothetical protein
MLSQPLTTLSQGDKSYDYCLRKNHTRETCWDLHGRPTRGRGRGQGRSESRFKQAYVADSTGQSGSSSDDMLAQLMTQVARRFSTNPPASATTSVASPSGVDGYNFSSLLTTVIKPIGTIMKALVAESSLDKSWIVDSGASKHMTPYLMMFKTYKPLSGRDKVVLQELKTGRVIGIGKRSEGVYRL